MKAPYRRLRAWISAQIDRRPRLQTWRLHARYARLVQTRLEAQLTFRAAPGTPSADGPRVFVALVESAHYFHLSVLILAKALQMRGARVTVLLCGSALEGCEVKNVRTQSSDPCVKCRFYDRHVGPLFGLDIVHIGDFFSAEELAAFRRSAADDAAHHGPPREYDGINVVPMVNDSVTRHFYGAEPDDPGAVRRVREGHYLTARMGVELARRIEAQYHPDVVLSHMYVYTDWEPYFRYFTAPGRARFISLGMSPYDYRSIVLNEFELYTSNDRFERFVADRGGRPLDDAESARLAAFVGERFSGNARQFRDRQFFDGTTDAVTRLGLDRSKRNLFLFSNIYWDIGMSSFGTLFDSVVDWVLTTIELVKDRPECHLYIKPHPAEIYDTTPSAKGIADFVRERYPVLPSNVSLIAPELKIHTYDLFPFIDLGVVYNGTVGLEMPMQGVPVVIVGKAPFGGLGFTAEPSTLDDYRAVLVGDTDPPTAPKAQLDLFAYFYFVKKQLPWRLTATAYADDFRGYTFDTLDEILPGRDRHLDHICRSILTPGAVIEAWTDDVIEAPRA